jgi:lipid II:glycine glycyltransferase (peptidoglycan interpeptide bridge formation enzyme)
VNSIKIRSSTGFEDPRGFQWSGYKIEPRFTYFLDLKRDKEEIYKNFQKRLRNYLRGNERVGIEIEEGSHENLEPILLLMKEKERIDAPLEFIHEAFNSFYPHNVRIFIAKHNDNFLSGLLVTIFKNKVSSWIGTPGVSFKGVYPNEFLFWHLIQWSMDQGMEYFEIMGADDLSLVPFKNKWNAEIRRSYLAKWMSPGFHRINSLYSLIRQKDLT